MSFSRAFNSLSRDHYGTAGGLHVAGTPTTFNSLSRDHSIIDGQEWHSNLFSFQLPLSGSQAPTSSGSSVGATWTAFNSLSRDHRRRYVELPKYLRRGGFQLPLSGSLKHSWTFTVVLEHVTFQLPLSGSHSGSLVVSDEGIIFQLPLSGSLTFVLESYVPERPGRLSTPSLGITRPRVQARSVSADPLSTPSLGITEQHEPASAPLRIDYFQLPLSGSRASHMKTRARARM